MSKKDLKKFPKENGRFVCSKKHIAPPKADGRWLHVDYKPVDNGSDNYATYQCLNCSHYWTEELPE
jgi:hypothetical protein